MRAKKTKTEHQYERQMASIKEYTSGFDSHDVSLTYNIVLTKTKQVRRSLRTPRQLNDI